MNERNRTSTFRPGLGLAAALSIAIALGGVGPIFISALATPAAWIVCGESAEARTQLWQTAREQRAATWQLDCPSRDAADQPSAMLGFAVNAGVVLLIVLPPTMALFWLGRPLEPHELEEQ